MGDAEAALKAGKSRSLPDDEWLVLVNLLPPADVEASLAKLRRSPCFWKVLPFLWLYGAAPFGRVI